MSEERFWLLVSLKITGEASEAELKELEAILQGDPALGLKYTVLEQNWRSSHKATAPKQDAYNRHLQRLSQHLNQDVLQYESRPAVIEQPEAEEHPVRNIYRRLVWTAGIAASLLVAWFLIGDKVLSFSNSKPLAQNTISTKRGSKSKVQLPDGTQVWLNADSRITYNEEFQGRIREVNLVGEAYFDVVRDEERPFVIHTNVIDIKVLGTAFNVRSYADEKNTETSLVRGSVEVTIRNHPEKKFTLKPNDKLIINNEQAAEAVDVEKTEKTNSQQIVLTWGKINYPSKQDTVATEAMWTRNKLAFDKETFEEIAQKLERWYDIEVIIKDEKIRSTEFSIIIEDESLQQVMEALRVAGKFRYSIDKKTVEVW
ncbi:MAG: FecR domain-containing protein [Chitinophagaceae bacterium]|nr:FecR domain-containing protein [Chitinophagaceae bacterium]